MPDQPVEVLDPEQAPLPSLVDTPPGGTGSLNDPSAQAGDLDPLALRYLRMFYEEWQKPFWQNLRVNVSTDFAYFNGTGQWSQAQRDKMAQDHKPALTINRIKPTCQALFGLERMNRYDPKAAAETADDVPTADVFTRLLRRTMYDCNGEYILSDGFEDGVIGGVVAFEMPISYDEDPLHGKIELQTVRVPDDLIWATPWRRYDLWDTRAMFRHKWVDVDDLAAHYWRQRSFIKEAMTSAYALAPADATRVGPTFSEGDPKDHYAPTQGIRPEEDRAFWFDEEKDRVRVLEVYYPQYFPTYLLASKDGKRVIAFTDEAKVKRIYNQIVARAGGGAFQLIQRNVRRIQMAVILPAICHTLEQVEPFEKDPTNYPFVPYFAYLKRDDVFGVVRDLRDSQDEINSRRSQIAWLTKGTGDGWFAEEGSLVDMKQFQDESRDPKGVYLVKKSATTWPKRVESPQVPPGLFELLRTAMDEIYLISGINPEASSSGQEGANISGVAIARRKEQTSVNSMSVFDNFRLTRRLIYQMMARRIQETRTDEEIVRLLNRQTGKEEFVTINQQVPLPAEPGADPSAEVRYRVLNDITALKADIEMVESPASPTARSAALANILELMQKMPSLAPIFAPAVVALSDGLPDRDEILQKVNEMSQRLLAPQGPPEPKTNISLKGDLPPQAAAIIAAQATGQREEDPARTMGGEAGNPANPSGQIPTGGAALQTRADLPPR